VCREFNSPPAHWTEAVVKNALMLQFARDNREGGSTLTPPDVGVMAHSKIMAAIRDQKQAAKSAPVCKAILLCDDVSRDPKTHKSDVNGVFDTFVLPSFPGSTPECKVFLVLVDAVGRYTIRAEVYDPTRGVVLYRSPGSGKFGSPRKTTKGELVLPVSSLYFDQDGDYEIVVFADSAEVARVQFKVRSN
jgi:hypothetical protein